MDNTLSVQITNYQVDNVNIIEIFNALGQQILTESVTSKVTKIDVSSLASGMYYLKPQCGKIEKFIVVH